MKWPLLKMSKHSELSICHKWCCACFHHTPTLACQQVGGQCPNHTARFLGSMVTVEVTGNSGQRLQVLACPSSWHHWGGVAWYQTRHIGWTWWKSSQPDHSPTAPHPLKFQHHCHQVLNQVFISTYLRDWTMLRRIYSQSWVPSNQLVVSLKLTPVPCISVNRKWVLSRRNSQMFYWHSVTRPWW